MNEDVELRGNYGWRGRIFVVIPTLKFIPYLLIVVLMSMILGCGGSGDIASESTEPAATATPTGADTSMPKATATPMPKATATPIPKATATPEQPVAQTIEWMTVEDEYKMYSIKVPKSWETATMVDDLDKDSYKALGEVGAMLTITSIDPETGSKHPSLYRYGSDLYR